MDDEDLILEDIIVRDFQNVINKLPHSKGRGRVPYTYHHDYLRSNVEEFKGTSRSFVASNHKENEIELYALALIQILEEQDGIDYVFNSLTPDDLIVCKLAMKYRNEIINKYSSNG